ncbi:MAG: hypothetical protein ICV77_12520 [Cyanobacteria bacterium Co-bin8]|nr:hypothetical protein [Cyanobacteria bacterium Co-bin8]
MAIPTRLRYWLVRFKVLNRPLLWCSGLAVVLLAVVAREYQKNPEWLGRFEVEGNAPSTALSDSTLSPDEQASIADIDNPNSLYSDLGLGPILPEPSPNQGEALAPQPSQDLLSILQSAAPASPTMPEATPGTATGPFASYLEQYRFLGSRNPLSSGTTQSFLQAPQPGSSLTAQPGLSGPPVTPGSENVVITPLQQAVQQYSDANSPTGATSPRLEQPLTGNGEAGSLPTGGSQVPGISPATLPGTNQTFLRTTPQMSPPPGTTGYVPPAVLNLPAPGSVSSPAAAPLPSATVVTPNLSPTSPGQPLPGSTMGSSGTTVLPPATGSVYDTPDVVTPPPFSAPRPPGSHVGGGYIYTFSDPNGPVR